MSYGRGTGPRAQQEIRNQQERQRMAEDCARWTEREAVANHALNDQHGSMCCAYVKREAGDQEYAFCLNLPTSILRQRHAWSQPTEALS
jgi:hypothetical protein